MQNDNVLGRQAENELSSTQSDQDETNLIFTHYMGSEAPYDENSLLAKFEVLDVLLGSGSTGNVYKCVARDGGPARAVKQIFKSKVNPGDVQQEINVLKRIDHPGVVQLIDHFTDDKCHYLVMELMENGSLMDLVRGNGALPEMRTRDIIKQVLETVRDLHAMGIVHRDIKPENILVVQNDPVIVKLSDFGLAKNTQDSILNSFCGTEGYLAPEIGWTRDRRRANSAEPARYSNKVDLWSIGCLCYILATGYLPFEGTSDEATIEAFTSGVFYERRLDICNFSWAGRNFIKRLLTVDPEKRPSAIEMLQHFWFSDEFMRLRSTNGDNDVGARVRAEVQSIMQAQAEQAANGRGGYRQR